MKRSTRDTIRKRPDYERDPDWDIDDALDGYHRHRKRTKSPQKSKEELFDEEGKTPDLPAD